MIQPLPESAVFNNPLLFQRFGFLARIESSEEITEGANRFEYTLQPGYVTGSVSSFTFESRGDEVTGINVFELNNSSTNVQGVNPSTLPAGFSFEPASGYVMCWPARVENSTSALEPVWLFCVPLTVDGSCP